MSHEWTCRCPDCAAEWDRMTQERDDDEQPREPEPQEVAEWRAS